MPIRSHSRFFLVLALLLLTGCGGFGLRYVYSQLEWIVPWHVRDFVRLDGEQRTLLTERVRDRLEWHCSSELPAYAAFVRRLEAQAAEPELHPGVLESHMEHAERLWGSLMKAVAPDLADILATFDDAQVEELAGNFEERNRETRAEFVDLPEAERHEKRVERMERRLQRWLGRFTAEQSQRVDAWSRALEPTTDDWFSNRIEWQRRLIEALGDRESRNGFDRKVAALLNSPDVTWTDDYRRRVAVNRRATLVLVADLYNSASAAQRDRLVGELGSLASLFELLACGEPSSERHVGSTGSSRFRLILVNSAAVG